MAAGYGRKPKSIAAQASFSPFRLTRLENSMNRSQIILLVEDRQADVDLTLRAFRKSGVANEVVVVRDGEEALDYLFANGPYAARDKDVMPEVVLLDLNLPKIDGLEVLR